jgi:hypothetical protein
MNISEIFEALKYGKQIMGSNCGKEFQITESDALFKEGKDKGLWENLIKSSYHKAMINEVIEEGQQYLKEPIGTLTYSLFKIYSITGSRKEYEDVYFKRRRRLNTFAILSLAYGKKEYIEALEDIMWAICDEYTWVLPAHALVRGVPLREKEEGFGLVNGKITGELRDHKKCIDLFSAETGFALSEIIYLLSDKLDNLVVDRAEKEIRERILKPFTELNSMFWWEIIKNNWSSVCSGSVGAAAIYQIEDEAVLAPILHRVLSAMEAFLSGFNKDGACLEGLDYWNYGFSFFVYFAELLRRRTAGKIDLMMWEKVKEIGLFQQKWYLSEDKIISFSDSSLSAKFKPGLTHYLKKRFNEVEIPDMRYSEGYGEDYCGRWGSAVRNFVWLNRDYISISHGPIKKDAVYYLEDSKYFITRKIKDGHVICFAAKGGHNDEPHNHNDIGSFILHVDGETLLADIGWGQYTKQYFGEERYNHLCNGSQGHSVPVVNGTLQSSGRDFEGKVINVLQKEEMDEFSLDISGAYDKIELKSLIRSFKFDKTGEIKLSLKDEFVFNEAKDYSIIERFMTFNKPTEIEKGIVRIQGEKSSVDIVFDYKDVSLNINKLNYKDHNANSVEVYSVELERKLNNIKDDISITFQVNYVKQVEYSKTL